MITTLILTAALMTGQYQEPFSTMQKPPNLCWKAIKQLRKSNKELSEILKVTKTYSSSCTQGDHDACEKYCLDRAKRKQVLADLDTTLLFCPKYSKDLRKVREIFVKQSEENESICRVLLNE